MLSHLAVFLAPLLLSFLSAPTVNSQAIGELEKVYYGAWVDPDLGYQDSPFKYNARLGRNASVFQIAQLMPRPPYNYVTGAGGPAPEYLIENTSTNAAVYLTVYPQSLTTLIADDYTLLANQILAYQSDYNRTVFLRWGPEMQGLWNAGYGLQPVAYVAEWRRMYQAIKQIAPKTAVVWAPNLGNGYPYGQATSTNATEAAALDTNADGQFNNDDDPYTPYYPGDDFVDWIGLSVYFKQNSLNTNVAQTQGFCSEVYSGINTQTNVQSVFNWYNMFCNKPGKACMVAESGAAYHPEVNVGTDSALAIQTAWWQDCITNQNIFTTYPRIKMHMHFEYAKIESDGGVQDLRDYRLTNDTAMLAAYQADLTTVQDYYEWATYSALASPVQSSGPGVSAPATATGSTPSLVYQTVRNPAVLPPTLFGVLISAAIKSSAPFAAGMTTALGLGAWLVGRRML